MFGSTWGNPQQNQQPQQTGAFGQPTGFGTSAFGSTGTSAFGQTPQQPQQQPQANPMFGNLGGATNTSGTPGFGAFGNTSTPQTNSLFGGAKPAAGFGAFGGGTGTFGGGGGGGSFGQPANAASGSGTAAGLFGQPSTTAATSAFGTGPSLFGSKPTTAFGGATSTTGATQGTVAPVTTGSLNPSYSVYSEKDPGTNSNVPLQYQSISCMPAYMNTSAEEIRLQDYVQGRKVSNTGTAFGQSTAFGPTQPATTGLFGAQSTQQSTTAPAFGAAGTTTGAFGSFGAPAATTAPASTSIFGGGGGFGQQQQQPQQQQQAQPTQGFGTFGANTQQPQQQTGGIFGGGTFGSNAAKPAGFGAFGGGATGGGGTFGGGTFGQQTQQPQQAQQPATGLFGGAQTQAPAATGFGGAFGANSNNKSIFGGGSTTQPTTGFGGFGATQQQQQQQPAQQTSLFGGGGLFGATNQQQPQNPQQTTPSLFGGGAATGQTNTGLFGGGGLFGGNTAQQQQQQQQQTAQQPAQAGGFGIFGPKPATTGTSLFGGGLNQQAQATAPQQPGLFGGFALGQTNNPQSSMGGGLFGARPAAPGLGASGSTGQTGFFGPTNGSTGLFGASTNVAGAQGTLTASISQPIGSDLAIFDMLPPGPRTLNLGDSQNKKKPGFFADVPTRSPVPRMQLSYTPANSKLRGFGASTSNLNGSTAHPSFGPGTANALSLSRVGDGKAADGFLVGRSSSPSLGSGGKPSVKKVILDKKVEPTEIFSKSGNSSGLRGGKVVFSPALSIAAREKDASPAPNAITDSPTPARPQRTPNRFTAHSTYHLLTEGQDHGTPELEEGDYWVKPDLATLKNAGYEQLSSYEGLVVGRVGYGEIHFLDHVDLTGLSKLGALLGEVVRFDDKECSVYPDSEEVDKPPAGSGLNVRARMSLLRCWTVDKATREPIKDAKHPAAIKHLKRLKNMKDTQFEGFDITEGKWTFTVDHF